MRPKKRRDGKERTRPFKRRLWTDPLGNPACCRLTMAFSTKRRTIPVSSKLSVRIVDSRRILIIKSEFDNAFDDIFTVYDNQRDQFLPAYSSYFNPLYGGVDPLSVTTAEPTTINEMIIQLFIALLLTVMILCIALCILYRFTKRPQEREEVINLRNSFR